MDTSYVAECNAEPVTHILKRMDFLIHTIVAEMFWKEYGLNKPGVLEHPISVCAGNFGLLYTADYTLGILFKVKLHNPADVQILAKDISNPTSIIYKAGVIYVAEKGCLSYLDVGNVVTLNPKALKKPRLQTELLKRQLLQPGEKATVFQMRQRLSEWIKQNAPDMSRENGLKTLVDGISPLALTADEDGDLLYVSQRDSATILKVTLTFTGAQLKGHVERFIKMPRKACCTGLAYSKESCDLYVVNSQDDGGIYIIDTAMETEETTYVKLVSNNTTTCSRAYCLTVVFWGDVYFTDVDARKIGRLTGGSAAEYVIGSGEETPSDGCEKTASFVQPTGLCAEGSSLYVTGTGAGALKVISPTGPMANLLQHVRTLYSSHGIHSSSESLSTSIRLMKGAAQYFEVAINKAKVIAGGRATVEGPHGVPSSNTVGSIRMTLEALKSIQVQIQSVYAAYVHQVCPKSLVTPIVEHFNSRMREVYDVPSVLQYAHQFPAAVEETVKRTTHSGFNYFTNRRSYYEVPEGMVGFGDLPKIPRPTKRPGTSEEVAELRKWAQDYGKATRQLSVRAKSTKDNSGTLPISAYGRRTLSTNPSSCLVEIRNSVVSERSSSSESDEDDVSRRSEVSAKDSSPLLPEFLGKESTLLVSHDSRITALFLLGMLVQDWRPYQPCDAAKMHIYSPDSENCLLFHYEFTGMVKLDQVVCKLRAEGSISYVDDDFHLEIDEAIYHPCVMELSQIPRKEPSTETAVRDKNSASSSRERSLRLPHRYRQ